MGYPFHQRTFCELLKGMGKCKLDDMHKEKVEALMVYDPKRKRRVPSRFCSFNIAGFNLDEQSTASLGPPYELDRHAIVRRCLPQNVTTSGGRTNLTPSSTDVISLRVVKLDPGRSYSVWVYGKVIARDELDYKCVFLFNRERNDAQLIRSEDEEEEEDDEEEELKEEEEEEDPKEEEKEPTNVVSETFWEHGSTKLIVKVDWTAILYTMKRNDYFQRNSRVPDGYRSPDYRWGGFLESD